MIIKKAVFVKSCTLVKDCPKTNQLEFAFIGRSNVGKSSLINMLTGNSKLAHTSANPGKTRTINHFQVNDLWMLVDLPGYGYAKTSKTQRAEFIKIIEHYLLNRENLHCLFVLIDGRIKPQEIDLQFIQWLGTNNIPFQIVFTKVDKPDSSEVGSNIEMFKECLLENWETLPGIIISSSRTSLGKEEILAFIGQCLKKK